MVDIPRTPANAPGIERGHPPCLSPNDAAIDRFTQAVANRLRRNIPPKDIARLLEELADHAHAALEDQNHPAPGTAEVQIDRILGSPDEVADAYLESWFKAPAGKTFPLAKLSRADSLAFVAHGLVVAFALAQVIARSFATESTAIVSPWSPAEIRSVVPDFLSFPSLAPPDLAWIASIIALPLVAGTLTAVLVPVRSAEHAYRAMVTNILVAILVAASLLPHTDGVTLVFALVAWGLPVTCATAFLTQKVLTQKALTRPLNTEKNQPHGGDTT